MKLFAALGTFLPCLCQTLFIAKGLKRQGTCRNISPCIKKANQGKKGQVSAETGAIQALFKRMELFCVFWAEFSTGTNEPRLWHLSPSMKVYL